MGQLSYQGPAGARWLQSRELTFPQWPALGTRWDAMIFSGCHGDAVELGGEDVDLGVHNFIIVALGQSLTFLGCGLITCTMGLVVTVPQGYRRCSEGTQGKGSSHMHTV